MTKQISLADNLEKFQITQAELARGLGVTRQMIQYLMNRERKNKPLRYAWQRLINEYFEKMSKKKVK